VASDEGQGLPLNGVLARLGCLGYLVDATESLGESASAGQTVQGYTTNKPVTERQTMSQLPCPQPLPKRQFASDNFAGICPEAMEAVAAANTGHAPSYGDDEWTRKVCDLLREFFEADCEVFFTFNGTAANSLAMATLCKSYHSIICQETSHLETDECGAPEFFSNGTKLLVVPGEEGKLSLDAVEHTVHRRSDIHYPKPHAISVTQATELGTVYTLDELNEIGALAKQLNLNVHMDGARLGNALVTLNASPAEATWQAGVDVLCLGGVKNGLEVGEAVVFFDRERAAEFDFRCKQAGQLCSKMRFISAAWIGLLQSGAYLRNAAQANRSAAELERQLCGIPGIRLMFPRQANSVFVELDPAIALGLENRGWVFYSFIGVGGARFMCSWDTQQEDIDALVSDIRELVGEKV